MKTEDLIDALAVTAEAIGQTITPSALLVMADDLSEYPPESVVQALRKVRRECRRMTLADIIDRMESSDGRPSADEAWMTALVAEDESMTVIWSEETQQAFEVARPALAINDKIGARMAFKAAYDRLVAIARENKRPAQWSASLGWDVEARTVALENAVRCGRLPASQASGLLPPPPNVERAGALLSLVANNGVLTDSASSAIERDMARKRIAELRRMLTDPKEGVA